MPEITPKDKLEREEEVIQSNFQSFILVGEALARIREQKLYLVTHANWDTYIRDRWNRSKSWGVQMAKMGEIVRTVYRATTNYPSLPPKVPKDLKPVLRTQKHVKALQSVPSEQRAEVLTEAVRKHGKNISARALEREANLARKKPIERDPVPSDESGLATHVQAALDAVGTFKTLSAKAGALLQEIEDLSATDVGAFLLQDMSHVVASVETIRRCLKFDAPYADCVMCTQTGCKVCRNTGWVPKLVWDALPEANKKNSYVINYRGSDGLTASDEIE